MAWPRRESSAADAADLGLPEDFGWACLLMLLHERPASSRELGDRLVGMGLAAGDPAGIELVLTALARAGLTRPLGGDFVCPTYRLTAAGTERLAAANEDLRRTQVLLERFIARCAERIVPHGGAGLHEQHPSAP